MAEKSVRFTKEEAEFLFWLFGFAQDVLDARIALAEIISSAL